MQHRWSEAAIVEPSLDSGDEFIHVWRCGGLHAERASSVRAATEFSSLASHSVIRLRE